MEIIMKLYAIEIEFLKVLFLGFFFGYWFFRLISNSATEKFTREIKNFKYFDLNRTTKLKSIDAPKNKRA